MRATVFAAEFGRARSAKVFKDNYRDLRRKQEAQCVGTVLAPPSDPIQGDP
jgi:hypothetical protein